MHCELLFWTKSQENWNLVLSKLLGEFRGTFHAGAEETANLLTLEPESRLPHPLTSNPSPRTHQAHHEYTRKLIKRSEEAHEMLREQQITVQQEDSKKPPLLQSGDLFLLQNVRRTKGENPKIQLKFVGLLNVTYSILLEVVYRLQC